jgi:hypothetical protein
MTRSDCRHDVGFVPKRENRPQNSARGGSDVGTQVFRQVL